MRDIIYNNLIMHSVFSSLPADTPENNQTLSNVSQIFNYMQNYYGHRILSISLELTFLLFENIFTLYTRCSYFNRGNFSPSCLLMTLLPGNIFLSEFSWQQTPSSVPFPSFPYILTSMPFLLQCSPVLNPMSRYLFSSPVSLSWI